MKGDWDRQKVMSIVCGLMAEGKSLRSICASVDSVPNRPGTILEWIAEDPELAEQYTRAMTARADYRFDGMEERAQAIIAEYIGQGWEPKDAISAARVLIDTEKWQLARMAAKKYGDKITQEHTGPNGENLSVNVVFKDANGGDKR